MSFTIEHHPETVVEHKKDSGFYWWILETLHVIPPVGQRMVANGNFWNSSARSAHWDGSSGTGEASKLVLNEGEGEHLNFPFKLLVELYVCMSTDWLLISWSTPSLHICACFSCSLPVQRSILWQRQCFIWLLLTCLCVHARAYTLSNKESVSHFWTAITVPLRKLSRWVWNMQQFVWSLRSPFKAAFACNYKRIGTVPCDWRSLFMLWSNFLFLGDWEKAASCLFFL